MASAISDDPDDRASLSTFRVVGAAGGMSATGFLIPMFIYTKHPDGTKSLSRNRFFIIAIVCADIAFTVYNIIYPILVDRVEAQIKVKLTVKHLIHGLF